MVAAAMTQLQTETEPEPEPEPEPKQMESDGCHFQSVQSIDQIGTIKIEFQA